MIGTGVQARSQILAHAALMPHSFSVWGRDADKVANFVAELALGFETTPVSDLESASRQADITITATCSMEPLLQSDWAKSGVHIAAVGVDAPGKQELDVALIAWADVLAVDLTL